MSNRTVHDNTIDLPLGQQIDPPTLLSTTWMAVLFAGLFRDAHEILRPGFVDELAHDGTVYGTEVTDTTLVASGFVLVFLVSVVLLSRILPRRANRRLNSVAAAVMAGGILATWPKDADDLVFGAYQLLGVGLVVTVCARWRDDEADLEQPTPELATTAAP